ncbi:MAG TPA: CheR family methyltransferase [Patescibacteria group bacterium]|nr:CheR family methyltransferase [Patescibacteria group bacterium]
MNRMTHGEQEALSRLIHQQYGLDFRQQRQDRLEAAVEKRMAACQETRVESYLQRVRQCEEETLRLVQLLTVHETYFFREPAQLAVLEEEVLSRLTGTDQRGSGLRLLSAGCSTGEEAYSLAIAMLNVPGTEINWDFEVIGVDVNPAAIKKARAGLYGEYSFRSCPELRRADYFEPLKSGRWAVRDIVKKKVRFETLNLFDPAVPERLNGMDIIFYRNVSIYFSREQRNKLLCRLANLLNPGGCLFLSCTETLDHRTALLKLVQSGEIFYYRKPVAARAPVPGSASGDPRLSGSPALRPVMAKPVRPPALKPARPMGKYRDDKGVPPSRLGGGQRMALAEALELARQKHYDAALARLETVIAVDAFCAKAYTLKANILLNRKRTAIAREACLTALALDVFCLEAYLLLGMAAKDHGEAEEALRRFKEAVYVHPECWLAHFHLAEVYQQRGENAYACREYEVTMGILQRGNMEQHGLSLFSTPFQPEDFIRVCQHHIEKLRT